MNYEVRHAPPEDKGRGFADVVALGLAWFGIGLGMAEVVVPDRVSRAVGLKDRRSLVRACGVREVATGIGLLRADERLPWVWARVAGDAIDLVTLATAFDRDRTSDRRLSVALAAIGGVTLLDLMCVRAYA